MIKALIFDVGGVLCMIDHPAFRKVISERYGVSEESFARVELESRLKLDAGEITPEQHLEFISERLGITIDHKEYWQQFFRTVELNAPLLDLIRKVKAQYQIFVLSNNNKPLTDYLAAQGIMKLFDRALFSFQVKMKKPDPAFFHKLLEGTGILPQECVFVDDRMDMVAAAEVVSMQAIHYRDMDTLEQAFRKLGMEW